MSLVWNEPCSVNHELLDSQHRKILGLINELDGAIMCGRIDRKVHLAAAVLVEFVSVHFRDQERLMCHIGYSGYERHQELHEEMTVRLVQLVERLQAGHTPCIFQLTAFLREWLVRHIESEDKRVTTAVPARLIQAEPVSETGRTMTGASAG